MSIGHAYTKRITAGKHHLCHTLMNTMLRVVPLDLILIGTIPSVFPDDTIAFSVETADVDDIPVPLWLVFNFQEGTCWLADQNKIRCSSILTLAQGELSSR